MNFKPFSEHDWLTYSGATRFSSDSHRAPLILHDIPLNWDNLTLARAKATALCGYGSDIILDASGLSLEVYNAADERITSYHLPYDHEQFPEALSWFIAIAEDTETSVTWLQDHFIHS